MDGAVSNLIPPQSPGSGNPELLAKPLSDLRQHFGQIEPGSPTAQQLAELYTLRAKLYREHGDPKRALADCEEAISLHPEGKEHLSLRDELQTSLGELQSTKTAVGAEKQQLPFRFWHGLPPCFWRLQTIA